MPIYARGYGNVCQFVFLSVTVTSARYRNMLRTVMCPIAKLNLALRPEQGRYREAPLSVDSKNWTNNQQRRNGAR